MRVPIPFKRFFSLSPSASSELPLAVRSHPPPSPLLPLVFPTTAATSSSTGHQPLPTTITPPLAFPTPFFDRTAPLRGPDQGASTQHISSSPPLAAHDRHHSPRQPTPPDPTPSPQDPPPPLSDAMWQSQFSLALSHLHTTLPLFFPPNSAPAFSPEIYHPNITLSLSIPLGGFEDMHGLTMYGIVFGGARRSLSLVLGGMWVRVERCTVLPPGSLGDAEDGVDLGEEAGKGGKVEGLGGEEPVERETSNTVGGVNQARLDRKVRIRVKVGGRLRLPLTVEGGLLGGGEGLDREWTISNLYTFSPLTALITHHKVETVHPAPGESVGQWLASWRSGGGGGMGGGGKPRTVTEGQGCANSSGVELERARVRTGEDKVRGRRGDESGRGSLN